MVNKLLIFVAALSIAAFVGCESLVPIVELGELDSKITPTYSPKPDYPPIAKESGMEGQVIVKVLVGSDGKVDEVEVSQSSGFKELDDAASSVAKKWEFTKPTKDGEPARVWVSIPFNFSLTGS
jgi:TonB family protein